jgi:hypothetical protein
MFTPRRIACANWPRPIDARVAVAATPEVQQLAVGEVGAGQHRRHAAVHGVEAVRVAEEVVGRLRRAADARELGDAVRLDVELPAGLHQRGRDRVVAAAGAQRADLAFVVAPREAECVGRQRRVMQLGFGEVGHATNPFLIGIDLGRRHALAIASVMKRAVIGVPSKC